MSQGGYIELYEIIEGADGRSANCSLDSQWMLIARQFISEAEEDGLDCQVYALEHFHAPTWEGECECAQYALDHQPVATTCEDD